MNKKTDIKKIENQLTWLVAATIILMVFVAMLSFGLTKQSKNLNTVYTNLKATDRNHKEVIETMMSVDNNHKEYLEMLNSVDINHKEAIELSFQNLFLINSTISDKLKKLSFYRGAVTNELQSRIELLEQKESVKTLIETVLENNANEIEYELNVYDCTQFAKEGVRRLNNYGIDAKTKKVKVDCNSGFFNKSNCGTGWHLIIKIKDTYWEATNGKLITKDKYEGYGLI